MVDNFSYQTLFLQGYPLTFFLISYSISCFFFWITINNKLPIFIEGLGRFSQLLRCASSFFLSRTPLLSKYTYKHCEKTGMARVLIQPALFKLETVYLVCFSVARINFTPFEWFGEICSLPWNPSYSLLIVVSSRVTTFFPGLRDELGCIAWYSVKDCEELKKKTCPLDTQAH